MQRASSFRTESAYAGEPIFTLSGSGSRQRSVSVGSLSNGGNERDSFTVNALYEG
jgi:hypothetical protein